MRKIYLILFISIVGVMTFASSTFAKETNSKEEIIFETTEITDVKELLERAKNNISDVEENKGKYSATLTPTNTVQNGLNLFKEPEVIELEPLSTTQVLKKVKKEDGTIVESLATSVFASFSSTVDGYDDSYSVSGQNTYYYDKYTTSGISGSVFHDITSVAGRWSLLDSSVILSQRKVAFGASGPRYPNGSYIQQTQTMYPTSNTFTYTAPSAWLPVQITHSVGVTSSVQLNRGGSTWTFTIGNNN